MDPLKHKMNKEKVNLVTFMLIQAGVTSVKQMLIILQAFGIENKMDLHISWSIKHQLWLFNNLPNTECSVSASCTYSSVTW